MKFVVGIFAMCLAAVAFGQTAPTTDLLSTAKTWIDMLSNVVLGLTVVATVVVRVIPGKKDDEAVASIGDKVMKVLHLLPTWGINPKTKEMEAALTEMKKQASTTPEAK